MRSKSGLTSIRVLRIPADLALINREVSSASRNTLAELSILSDLISNLNSTSPPVSENCMNVCKSKR